MTFQAELAEHAAGHAGDEFWEAFFHAVFLQFLAGFGGPEVFFQLGERDGGFVRRHVFAFGHEPDEFLVAGETDREGDELEFDLLFFVGFVRGVGVHLDLAGELIAIGEGHFHGEGLLLLVGLDGHVGIIAEGGSELFFDFGEAGGFEVGQGDLVAEGFERFGAGLGFEFVFDGAVNLASELGVISGFRENLLEQIQKLQFGVFLRFFFHTSKTGDALVPKEWRGRNAVERKFKGKEDYDLGFTIYEGEGGNHANGGIRITNSRWQMRE